MQQGAETPALTLHPAAARRIMMLRSGRALAACVALQLCATSAVSAFGPGSAFDTVSQTPTIVGLAAATPDLSTLVAALKAANLVGTLSGSGPFTVFAPSNEAFAKLPPLYLKLLLDPANVKTLQKLLTYHVVAGTAAFAADLTNGEKIETVEGEDVSVSILHGPRSTTVKINDATVTTADVAASNGVVHIVDTVLMPDGMPPSGPVTGTIAGLAANTSDLHARHRAQGRRPRRHALRPGPVHRVRAEQRGVCGSRPGRACRPAQAKEQGAARGGADIPRRRWQGHLL